jgi:hypothetical protein
MIDVDAIRAELNARWERREIKFPEYRRELFAAVRQWKREQREEKARAGNLELLAKLDAGGLTLVQEYRLKVKLAKRWWKQTGCTREQFEKRLKEIGQ